MDDFSKYEEYRFRQSSAFATSEEYQQLAVDSLNRGDEAIAKFQISQQLRWYSAFAALRDAMETGQVHGAGEYLDEFISKVFSSDSPYLSMKDKVCGLMGWDAHREHIDERIVTRFIDSIYAESKKAV